MTSVVSIRVPVALERAVRGNAAHSNMPISEIARLILEHALCGTFNFALLSDTKQFLDTKLDFRFTDALISKLRLESQRLALPFSVYIRIILYAYYSKRLVFVDRDGRYTLEQNHDQKASA
jgi:hypothetical protein